MADLKTLYCSECGGTHVQILAWVDANTGGHISDADTGDVWCDDCWQHTDLATLPELWKKFADVPVNADGEIEEDFLCFEERTPKYTVWQWFDNRCPNGLEDDLMFNDNEYE